MVYYATDSISYNALLFLRKKSQLEKDLKEGEHFCWGTNSIGMKYLLFSFIATTDELKVDNMFANFRHEKENQLASTIFVVAFRLTKRNSGHEWHFSLSADRV